MNKDEDKSVYSVAFLFGGINIALVVLCYFVRLAAITTGLIFFLILGIYASYLSISRGIEKKEKKDLIFGILAMLVNIAAGIIYLMVMIAGVASQVQQ